MRIRTVKPEFWSHPVLSRQEDGTRMLAIALLNIADDEGFFHADPALIRSAVWPFDEDSTKARRALESLSKIGWIELNEHPTHGMIGRVVNFTKHQRVDRPSDSKIKVYFDSASIRRGLDDQSPPEQGTGNREQGIKTPSPKPKTESAAKGGLSRSERDFLVFWEKYPKKVGKEAARKAWAKVRNPSEVILLCLEALIWQVESEQWQKDGGQFIPNPATYLNQQRWLDEKPEPQPPTPADKHPKWWATDEATIKYGEAIGVRARPGELMPEYRARLREIRP